MMTAFFLLGLQSAIAADPAYTHSVEQWRQEREERLKKEDGWLSLIGLYWLKDGSNTLGTAADSRVKFPQDALPPQLAGALGTFELKSGKIAFTPASGLAYEVNDKAASGQAFLVADESGKPDVLKIGRVKLFVIKRSLGFGIRMKDPEASTRKHFKGLHWYPVNESFRFKARFIAAATPKKIMIPNILGGSDESVSPGEVAFTLGGKEQRLVAVEEGDELFFIFKDPTNDKGTYSAGRFLNTPKAQDGFVDLDFNKAYTPPCGFTRYATCPLPPKENFMKTAISAGEKFSGHPH